MLFSSCSCRCWASTPAIVVQDFVIVARRCPQSESIQPVFQVSLTICVGRMIGTSYFNVNSVDAMISLYWSNNAANLSLSNLLFKSMKVDRMNFSLDLRFINLYNHWMREESKAQLPWEWKERERERIERSTGDWQNFSSREWHCHVHLSIWSSRWHTSLLVHPCETQWGSIHWETAFSCTCRCESLSFDSCVE